MVQKTPWWQLERKLSEDKDLLQVAASYFLLLAVIAINFLFILRVSDNSDHLGKFFVAIIKSLS